MKDYLDELVERESQDDPEFAAKWAELQARKSLARLRQDRHLTQAAVAGLMGLPQSRVAEIERNPGKVSFARVAAYAKAVGISIEDIARVGLVSR
jgi:transcriptional regulator with XRE-family HTH domain